MAEAELMLLSKFGREANRLYARGAAGVIARPLGGWRVRFPDASPNSRTESRLMPNRTMIEEAQARNEHRQ